MSTSYLHEETIRLFVKLINISPRATLMRISFEELATLFKDNPIAGEAKVNEIMEDYFQSLEPERQQRARALHWRLQMKLRKYKDPVARMNIMVEEFWKGVQSFQKALTNPQEILNQQGIPSDVIQFPDKLTPTL